MTKNKFHPSSLHWNRGNPTPQVEGAFCDCVGSTQNQVATGGNVDQQQIPFGCVQHIGISSSSWCYEYMLIYGHQNMEHMMIEDEILGHQFFSVTSLKPCIWGWGSSWITPLGGCEVTWVRPDLTWVDFFFAKGRFPGLLKSPSGFTIWLWRLHRRGKSQP